MTVVGVVTGVGVVIGVGVVTGVVVVAPGVSAACRSGSGEPAGVGAGSGTGVGVGAGAVAVWCRRFVALACAAIAARIGPLAATRPTAWETATAEPALLEATTRKRRVEFRSARRRT